MEFKQKHPDGYRLGVTVRTALVLQILDKKPTPG
jgi:hypothetical protein